jgi:hypothetical protein
MIRFVGFDNNFPRLALETRLDEEATFHHVSAERRRVVEHAAQLDLVEAAVLHPFSTWGVSSSSHSTTAETRGLSSRPGRLPAAHAISRASDAYALLRTTFPEAASRHPVSL